MLQRNWDKIDRYAEKATDEDGATFDSLLSYFEKVIPSDIDRDINMLRAITYWMYCYESRDLPEEGLAHDSPLKLLSDLHHERLSYAAAYEKLCTKFGIKCRIVKGISKSGSYQPGDTPGEAEAKKKMSAIWNKVFIEGKWQPVYPRWIVKTLKNAPRASTGEKTTTEQASHRAGFKEFWFLTDPELFISKCYPDDIDDQMLPRSKQVKSIKKFFRLPYLTLHFFKDNLKLISEDSCVIDADDGVGKVHFKTDKIPSKKLAFDYKLAIRERNGPMDISKRFDIPRLVLNSRNKGNFIFEVRCPEVADYTLEIIGGPVSSEQKKVYIVTKIICREKLPSVLPLPLNPGPVGWGFGPYAIEAGLLKSNICAPKIAMVAGGKTVHFEIKIDQKLVKKKEYKVDIVQNDEISKEDLAGCLETEVDKSASKMKITVGVPREGEFALRIQAADIVEKNFTPVCYFLLSTYLDEETVEDEYYDSSDGTSDIDEEIDDLRKKVEEMKIKRDELRLKYGGLPAQSTGRA